VLGAAIVPASPLLLADTSPAQPDDLAEEIADLRTQVADSLSTLPAADGIILLAAGARGFHDHARGDLAQLGLPGVDVEMPVCEAMLPAVTRLTQYPMIRGEDLDVDLSVLALQVQHAFGEVEVLPVRVPSATAGDVLVAVGASLVEALRGSDLTATVVCAGDLSATLTTASPGYVADGAADWDHTSVRACRTADANLLASMGPEEAKRVGARGWAPLTALLGVVASARLKPGGFMYGTPCDVGQLVGTYRPRR
jgi:hypothetical protein